MKKTRQLHVLTPEGESGLLSKESRYVFNYTSKDKAKEVSLVMPLRAESYASGTMIGPFSMNLPEGFLKEKIESRLSKFGGVDDMRLLEFTGQNQIGRLSFASPESQAKMLKPIIGKKELLEESSSIKLFEFLLDAYLESGISGVQPKVVIPDADITSIEPNNLLEKTSIVHSNLIVKTGGDDYPGLAINEFLCMTAAKNAQIQVPDFWLSNNAELFIMDRFDLSNGSQLGFEDMSILMGKHKKDEKYQSSYESVVKAVNLFCGDTTRLESLQRLFEYVTLSIMVRNGDAHLKNFGLLYDTPGSSNPAYLSPLFDVVTTSAYDLVGPGGTTAVDRTMALKMRGSKNYPNRQELLSFAQLCSVNRPDIIIERIADAMQKTLVDHLHRMEAALGKRLKSEWDAGRQSLTPSPFLRTRITKP